MLKHIVTLVAPMLLLSAVATAASTTTKSDTELVDVQSATCAQYAKAIRFADPGKNPSKKKAAMAVLAQDDLVLAMTWLNGYLTGRDGAKAENTFNKEWIVDHMDKLTAVCNANPATMRLTDAAAKL